MARRDQDDSAIAATLGEIKRRRAETIAFTNELMQRTRELLSQSRTVIERKYHSPWKDHPEISLGEFRRLSSESSGEISQELDRTLAKQEFVDEALFLMRSDYASIQMLFPERGSGGQLRLLAFRGFNPEAVKFWEWVNTDSKSTCGIALHAKKRVVATDIARCDFMLGSDDQQVYLQTGIRACQTTPLIGRGGNVVGMISTHWCTPHEPSENDLRSFDTLAARAAELIESCRPHGDWP